MSRASLLLAARLPPEAEAALAAAFEVHPAPDDAGRDRERLLAALVGRDALVVFPDLRVDAGLIARLPASVRAIATYSVGVEHVDLAAARGRGIAVLNTPGVLSDAVAEVAMLLMLGAARRATEAIDLLRRGHWTGVAPCLLVGVELRGRRLGILGMGRIGRAVAVRAQAFGMTVAYHNRRRLAPDEEGTAEYVASLDALLAGSDVLLVACPSTSETRGLLDAARIARLKPGAIIVNVARGDVIVEDALIGALREGRVLAAGLDVFDGEPAVDPRWFELPNAFLLPHIGSATRETRTAMAQCLADGILSILRAEAPSNRVA